MNLALLILLGGLLWADAGVWSARYIGSPRDWRVIALGPSFGLIGIIILIAMGVFWRRSEKPSENQHGT